ncbi:alpha-acetolactate synthase [Synechococcus sp. RS9917]|nr:alpha-acetolactate synthase [Synechococcus sp. RS9917]
MNGAEFLVKALQAHGVTHVFGIPGAKVDSVFTALLDSPIELVLCRHEQNAAFMAQAFGRLTGRVGHGHKPSGRIQQQQHPRHSRGLLDTQLCPHDQRAWLSPAPSQ